MLKCLFSPLLLFIFSVPVFAQKPSSALPNKLPPQANQKLITDSALKFYERGLKAFNEKNYRTADSLYSISILIKQHPDTYYNRALTRAALNNTEGYCEDICSSATMGDAECDGIFRSECGSADTIYTDKDNKPATKLKHVTFSVIYQSDYREANIAVKFNKQGKFLDAEKFKSPENNKIPDGEILPEFQGGTKGLADFVKNTTKMPESAKLKKISGKVLVSFVVNRMGFPENITVLKAIDNCPECSREAVRVISAMPRWKPGALNGKTAKCNYNLGVDFFSGG